jgi:Cu(I)/Ag(I) efflux system membrane protein CusA/SilA
VKGVPGTLSAFAERTMGGNYIQFNIDRDAIARYGLTVGDVQDVLEVALGGMPLTTTVEGLERYAVNLRYSRDFRESLGALREIIVPTPTGAQVPLGQLAKIETVHAPMGIKSEAAVPNAWIYVDVKGIDIGTYVQTAMRAVNEALAKGEINLPSGYTIFWSGQYEYMQRAKQRLLIVVPLTLLIIVLIIYLNTSAWPSGSASLPWRDSTPKPASSCCSISTWPTPTGRRRAGSRIWLACATRFTTARSSESARRP